MTREANHTLGRISWCPTEVASPEQLLVCVQQPNCEESVVESTLAERTHQALEVHSKEQFQLITTNDSGSEVNHNDDTHYVFGRKNNLIRDATHDQDYLWYNNEVDDEAYVHAFLPTGQANHVSQHVVAADANASKIAELGLSLEGQSAN